MQYIIMILLKVMICVWVGHCDYSPLASKRVITCFVNISPNSVVHSAIILFRKIHRLKQLHENAIYIISLLNLNRVIHTYSNCKTSSQKKSLPFVLL